MISPLYIKYKAGWSILAPLSVSQMMLSYGEKN